ncbi:MAG TPA: fimbria/pilus periplasmic chaperone [Rhizomicrobium sp.]
MRKLAALAMGIMTAGGLAVITAKPAIAGALEVAPTTINFPAGTDRAVIYVTNHGAEAVVIQIQGFDWRQTGGIDQMEKSDALILSPPMARLLPEKRQTIRLALKSNRASTNEQAFRLILSELPDPQRQPQDPPGVQVLLQLSLPVFAEGSDPRPAPLTWSAAPSTKGVSLAVHNNGTTHVKLLDLVLTTSEGTHIPIAPGTMSYVLAGGSHHWESAIPNVKAGDRLHITGHEDSRGTMIDAPIIVTP